MHTERLQSEFSELQELEAIRVELENPAVQFPDYYLKAQSLNPALDM